MLHPQLPPYRRRFGATMAGTALLLASALAPLSGAQAASSIPAGHFYGHAHRTPGCTVPHGVSPTSGHRWVTDCWTGTVTGLPFTLKTFWSPDRQGYAITVKGHTYTIAAGPVSFYRFSGVYACFMTQAGAFAEGVDLREPLHTIMPLSAHSAQFYAVCGGSLPAEKLGYVTGIPGREPIVSGTPLSAVQSQATRFPAVVSQALTDVYDANRDLPLGGPTLLPPEPPSRLYLTAETETSQTAYTVHVLKTAQPLAVDSPALKSPKTHPQAVASFGVTRLSVHLPAVGSPHLAPDLWQDGLVASGLQPNALGPLEIGTGPGSSVSLGLGISATLYPVGVDSTLVWHEGDWTLVVRDISKPNALAIGRNVVTYLHRAYMPPYPGLVVIGLGVHGFWTRLDWLEGTNLYRINNDLNSTAVSNPVAACEMAVHWQADA